jgi:hypothetical protein
VPTGRDSIEFTHDAAPPRLVDHTEHGRTVGSLIYPGQSRIAA